MHVKEEINEFVGRAFISYVKKCLKHARGDYFKKQNRDLYRIIFLGNFIFDVTTLNMISISYQLPSEDYILLLQARV